MTLLSRQLLGIWAHFGYSHGAESKALCFLGVRLWDSLSTAREKGYAVTAKDLRHILQKVGTVHSRAEADHAGLPTVASTRPPVDSTGSTGTASTGQRCTRSSPRPSASPPCTPRIKAPEELKKKRRCAEEAAWKS